MKRLALLLLLIAAAPDVKAQPVLRDDFASYSEGEQPLLPPDGNPFTWRFDTGYTAQVHAEDGRNILQVRRPAGLPYGTFGRGFEAGAGNLTMRMQLRLPSGSEKSDYFLILGHYETNRHAGPVKVRIHNGRLSAYYGTENAAKMAPDPLVADLWHTLIITLDNETDHYRLTLLRESDGKELYASGPLAFVMETPPCNTLLIRPQESRDPNHGALEWDIADLLIETES